MLERSRALLGRLLGRVERLRLVHDALDERGDLVGRGPVVQAEHVGGILLRNGRRNWLSRQRDGGRRCRLGDDGRSGARRESAGLLRASILLSDAVLRNVWSWSCGGNV